MPEVGMEEEKVGLTEKDGILEAGVPEALEGNAVVAEECSVTYEVPVEPGLYTVSEEEAGLSGLPLLDAVFATKESLVDTFKYVGQNVVARYRKEAIPSEDMNKLAAKISDVKGQLERFLKEKSVRSFQAKTIGCKKCGSQLAKEYLKDDCCPLCGNDLRAPSTIAGEADYRQRIAAMEAELADLGILNQVQHGEICYLLKIV